MGRGRLCRRSEEGNFNDHILRGAAFDLPFLRALRSEVHAAAVELFADPQFDQLKASGMNSAALRGSQSGGRQTPRNFAQSRTEPAAPPFHPRIAAPEFIFERECWATARTLMRRGSRAH